MMNYKHRKLFNSTKSFHGQRLWFEPDLQFVERFHIFFLIIFVAFVFHLLESHARQLRSFIQFIKHEIAFISANYIM